MTTTLNNDLDNSVISTDGDKTTTPLITIATLLDEKDPAALDRFRAGVRAVPTSKLVSQLGLAYFDNKRIGAFLINEELTRRNFPPCFRRLPDPMISDNTERFDIFIADAQWIASRYPKHIVSYVRYNRLFKSDAFHKTATFIFYFGKRPAWQIVKGLALTDNQQWECHWLHSGPMGKKYKYVHERFPKIKEQIWQKLFHGNRGGQSEEECIATIERRRALWLCSAMSDGRPQRTADLYEMYTGKKIARNAVAKQLEKIKRDVR